MDWKDKGDKFLIYTFFLFLSTVLIIGSIFTLVKTISRLPFKELIKEFLKGYFFDNSVLTINPIFPILITFSISLSSIFWKVKGRFISLSEFFNIVISLTTFISSFNFLIFKLPSLSIVNTISIDEMVVLGLGPIALMWLSIKTIIELIVKESSAN